MGALTKRGNSFHAFYCYRKRIPIHRLIDLKKWSLGIAAAMALFMAGFLHVFLQSENSQLKSECDLLDNIKARTLMRFQESTMICKELSSPERIRSEARKLGMVEPNPGTELVLAVNSDSDQFVGLEMRNDHAESSRDTIIGVLTLSGQAMARQVKYRQRE
jgi:cell division protein FtsL